MKICLWTHGDCLGHTSGSACQTIQSRTAVNLESANCITKATSRRQNVSIISTVSCHSKTFKPHGNSINSKGHLLDPLWIKGLYQKLVPEWRSWSCHFPSNDINIVECKSTFTLKILPASYLSGSRKDQIGCLVFNYLSSSEGKQTSQSSCPHGYQLSHWRPLGSPQSAP